jgi:ankyrin repeat protein
MEYISDCRRRLCLSRTRDRRTPLHIVATYGIAKVAQIILGCLEDSDKAQILIAQECLDATALHRAAFFNMNSQCLKLLLKQKSADVTSGDNQNRTPLYYAYIQGHVTSIELLISKINVEDFQFGSDISIVFLCFGMIVGHQESKFKPKVMTYYGFQK